MPAYETKHFLVKRTNVINLNVLLGTNVKNEKQNHLPKDYHVCQMSHMIAVKKCHGMRSSPSVLAWISSVNVSAWLSFRKIYLRKASFSKNLLQFTDKNFLPIIS